MDYDDKEFQGQNSHIDSEGISKFSPASHPYSLPNFDFDDGLQGHLRFDNLVENEAFLSIPNQEDNQWIEDFSRGSGGNNVWSEATSSESVEMLLKSVGQDESCQNLDSVAEQMESHFKEDDKTVDNMVSDLPLVSEIVTDNNSVLNDVKGVSSSPEVEISTDGDTLDKRLGEESIIEVHASLNKSSVSEMQGICGSNMDTEVEDSISQDLIANTVFVDNQNSTTLVPDVDSDMHTEVEDSILQDITVNTVSVDNQNPTTMVPNDGSEMLTEVENSVSQDGVVKTFCFDNQESTTLITNLGSDSASVKAVNEEVVFAKELQVDDENLKEVTPIENLENIMCSSTKLEVVETKKLEEPSSFTVIGSSNMHIAEKCDEDVFDSGPELIESSNMALIHQQIDENIQENLPKDFQGEGNAVAHVIEINTNTAEEVVNSSGEVEKEFLLQGTGQQPVTDVSASENETTLLSKLDNTISECQGHRTSTSLVVEHSIEVKDHSVENVKFCDDASVVNQGSSAEDFLSPPSVSDQVVSNSNSPSPLFVSDQVASNNEEEKPTDSSGMECEIIEPSNNENAVGISSNLESSQQNNEAVWESERDDSTSIVPDVTAETLSFFHEGGATDDIAADQTREKMKFEEAGSNAANLTPLKETSKSADMVDPVLEIDKGPDSSLTEELSQKTADHSAPVVGILNTANKSEQAKKAEKTHQISECSSLNVGLFSSICEPSCKQYSVADESATSANYGATGKDHSLASSAVSDLDVSTPTISGCNVPDKSKNEKEIVVEKSLVKSFPPAVSVESASKDAKQCGVVKDGKSLTFEVVNLSSCVVAEDSQDKQFIPNTQSFTSFKEGSPLTPSIGTIEPKTVVDPSLVRSQTLDANIEHGSSTATPVRKKGRPSNKIPKTVPDSSRVNSQVIDVEIANGSSTGTPSRKRGRPFGTKNKSSSKETTTSTQSKKGDSQISSISTSLTGTGKLQFEEVKLQEKAKHSTIVPVVTPTLPDLNTSASPSAIVVRQPFSDIQQMQLRAQIFVYGSLIQGAAPDETCMVAAFGTSDGGRTMWEPVWRAFVEKLQGVKSNSGKSETPLLHQLAPNAGSGPPKQSSAKNEALQSSVLLPPVGRASFKGTPSPVVNPMIPLSSPLWNVSTPFHGMQSPGMMPRSSVFDYRPTPSASHPFQTPPSSRNAAVNNSPWPSHTSFPASWITTSQSSSLFDPSARLPTTENLKLNTPIQESVPRVKESVPPSVSGANHPFPSASVSVEPYPPPVMNKITVSSGQKTAEPKTRKRKKSSAASENLTSTPVLSQARLESVPFPVPSLSQAQTDWVPSPIPFLSQARPDSVPALIVPSNLSTSVIVSTPLLGSKGNDSKLVTITSPTNMGEQPKRVEPIEKMMYLPENNALIKNEEAAKQQAEEAAKSAVNAVNHCETVWEQLKKQKSSGLKLEVEANLASAAVAVAAAVDVAKAAAAAALVAANAASQAKIMFDESLISSKVDSPSFNGDGSNCSSSILVAAKETARKRLEATSFASKLAENLDAVLKAAELASSAASQVGRIVAMGDPPSLAKLVEAGPQGYWRTTPQVNTERSNIGITQETLNVSGDEPRKKKAKSTSRDMFTPSGEVSKKSMEDHVKGVEGTPDFFTRSEQDSRERRDSRVPDLDKTIGVIPESESGLTPPFIEEGCFVEVKKEGNGFKEAWFSANVLSLVNGKALVSFTGSRSGSSEPKEWVQLEGDADNEPRIRIAHSDKQFDGNKKRRRGEFGNRVWYIGDKVDVWTRECWREGVVTDKNKVDDTILTVHFPAEGEISVVKAWNLRPTLIWKDGEWIENSSSRQKDPSYKGDTPKEKRLKLGEPSVEGSKKDLSLTYQRPGPARPEELQLLPLSDKERMFNIGNDNKEDTNLDARKTGRGGLQKEGARVVFGVPKPGRTKKFMDVSKHYVAESSNKTDDKSREKKIIPRDDGKVKQLGELKARIPRTGKAMSSFGRTIPQKDKVQSSTMPAKKEARRSTSTDESEPEEKRKRSEFTFSSSALSRDMFTSKTKLERPKGRNRAPVAGRWAKGEAKDNIGSGKQVPDLSEPRRSNRRIQPTSRLLEGLQTSLTLPKFPSFAHDKGQRSHSRSTPKR